MKVAYWPGCVSRGFTPELHGSMAKVAPLLDLELIELDRAACCGAGVIAEHSQELADTLNARTFALAQQTDGELMMNICSTCQGAQSECQERLDSSADYRAQVNGTLSAEGLTYETGLTNKNFLWLLVEEIGLDRLRAFHLNDSKTPRTTRTSEPAVACRAASAGPRTSRSVKTPRAECSATARRPLARNATSRASREPPSKSMPRLRSRRPWMRPPLMSRCALLPRMACCTAPLSSTPFSSWPAPPWKEMQLVPPAIES